MSAAAGQDERPPITAEQAVVQMFDVLMTFGGRVATNAVPGYVFVQGHHGAPVAFRVG